MLATGFFSTNKMKKRTKYLLYVGIVLVVYGALFFSFNSPAEFFEILATSEKELGIISFPINSVHQEGPTQIKVLLPKDFKKEQRYKVLYVLPVSSQGFDAWWMNGLRVIAKLDVPTKYQIICVYPTFARSPWYGDSPSNPRIRQESYMVKDVVPFVDGKYNTYNDPQGRYLLGFSRSGFGAVVLLLRHLDIFGRAASWDGTLIFNTLDHKGSGL